MSSTWSDGAARVWSDGAARLAAPLALSLTLHLTAGAALDALPWRVSGAAPGTEQRAPAQLRARLAPESRPAIVAADTAVPVQEPLQTAAAAPAAPAPDSTPAPRYFASKELDARPQALAPIEPAYPNDAYLRSIAGRVRVQLSLSETGEVEKAVVVYADPPGYFEEAVKQAFQSARFTPGMRGGQPVKVQMTVEVRYDPPVELILPPGAPPGLAAPAR